MKAGWELKTLGDVCEILDRLRKPITKRNRVPGPYPYYGATGVLDHVDGFLFNETLVLLGEDGAKWEPGAKSAFSIDGKTWVNNHAHVMRPNRAIIDDNWLIYFLNFSDLMPFVSGMTVPKLNQGSLREIPIPLPPLAEQKRIVSILDEAFEGLDRARGNAEANLKSARELFSETIRLNLKARDNWVSATLSKCFRLRSGDNLTSKSMVTGPFEVYGGNGIAGKHNASNLSGDNVIIGRVGALCGRARCISKDIWLTDNAFKVVDYNYDFDPRFLARLLNFLNLGSLARQAAQPVISNSSLKDLMLQFPLDLTEQTVIADKLDKYEIEIDTVRGHYRNKLQDISDLRQSLLQKAFAGELT